MPPIQERDSHHVGLLAENEDRDHFPRRCRRLRVALNDLFPETSRAAPPRRDGQIAIGVFLISAAMLSVRAPFSFSKIFADDGSELLGNAARGLPIESLFKSYRGCLSVIPRLAAEEKSSRVVDRVG
jgi:hypothetical protein